MRGDGNFTLSGMRYPFRVSSGQSADGSGTRVHLNIDPGARALSADLDGVLCFEARAPRFEGAVALAVPPAPKAKGGVPRSRRGGYRPRSRPIRPQPGSSRSRPATAPKTRALKFAGLGDIRFGASPLLHAVLSARQLDADKFVAKEMRTATRKTRQGIRRTTAAEPMRLLPALRALMAAASAVRRFRRRSSSAPSRSCWADVRCRIWPPICMPTPQSWSIDRLDLRAPGATAVALQRQCATAQSGSFKGALNVESSDPDALVAWLQGRSEVDLSQPKAAAPARQCQRRRGPRSPSTP